MKKLFVFLLAAGIVSLGLPGCGGGGEEPSKTDHPHKDHPSTEHPK